MTQAASDTGSFQMRGGDYPRDRHPGERAGVPDVRRRQPHRVPGAREQCASLNDLALSRRKSSHPVGLGHLRKNIYEYFQDNIKYLVRTIF